MSIKKSLPVLPKSLATEILPEPSRSTGPSNARERVLRRVTELTRNAALLGTSAAMAAACMDPYGVVDPIPPPFMCPAADALTKINRAEVSVQWGRDGASILIEITKPQITYRGTNHVVSVDSSPALTASQPMSAGVQASVELLWPGSSAASSPPAWPALVQVTLHLECVASSSTPYDVSLRLDTSKPASSSNVPFEVVPDAQDAGI